MDSSGNESDFSMSVTITITISNIGKSTNIPTHFYLSQNYPNPFNPMTTIRYGLPKPGHVKITIYDILGHKVRELVDAQKSAGHHKALWDGKNMAGDAVSTGIYYYKIIAKDFNQIKKMLLIK
jgi:hypothetical protein